MSNLQRFYTKFLSLLHGVEDRHNFFKPIRKPKVSDIEIIALSLAAEASGIDSELSLFKQLPDKVIGQIERSVYNKRRRKLSCHISRLQQNIAHHIVPEETYHLIDSMPLEVCKYSRVKRSKVCSQHTESAPDYGYCAAQKLHYFGYKIHGVCTAQGVFKTFDISKASTHDIHYLHDVKAHIKDCVLIGDKGYISQYHQGDLFDNHGIELCTPKRRNQLDHKPFPCVYRKARKRIETA